MDSHFGSSTENFPRPLDSVRVTEFFGHVTEVRQLQGTYPLEGAGSQQQGQGGQQQAQDAGPSSCGAKGAGACPSLGGASGESGGGGRAAAAAAGGTAALVKGRLRGDGGSGSGNGGGGSGNGGSGGQPAAGGEWGSSLDGMTLGAAAGLVLAVAASSLAWGRCHGGG
jgi:hypothetical protein